MHLVKITNLALKNNWMNAEVFFRKKKLILLPKKSAFVQPSILINAFIKKLHGPEGPFGLLLQ